MSKIDDALTYNGPIMPNYEQTMYYDPTMAGQPIAPQQIFYRPMNDKNALTEEEIKKIAYSKPVLDLTVPEEEELKAMCTHKHIPGQECVFPINDGTGDVWCSICKIRWNPEEQTEDELVGHIKGVVNAMENAKMIGDLPIEVSRRYFQFRPFLMKLPEIYKYAMHNLAKFGQANGYQNNDIGLFQMYNSVMGGMNPYMPYNIPMTQPQGYMQQPGMPGYNPQQIQQPGMPGYNPQQIQQPGMPGYNPQQPVYMPQQIQQPGMPAPGPYAPAGSINPMQQMPQGSQFGNQAQMMMQGGGGYYQQPVQPAFTPAQPQAPVQQSAPAAPQQQETVKETVVKLG